MAAPAHIDGVTGAVRMVKNRIGWTKPVQQFEIGLRTAKWNYGTRVSRDVGIPLAEDVAIDRRHADHGVDRSHRHRLEAAIQSRREPVLCRTLVFRTPVVVVTEPRVLHVDNERNTVSVFPVWTENHDREHGRGEIHEVEIAARQQFDLVYFS